MEQFHVICGLPRSGSTLLCDILNQNEGLRAGSTSGLCHVLNTMQMNYTNMPEYTSMLIGNRKETELSMITSMQAVCEAWTSRSTVNFDKGRMWNNSSLLLRKIYPESKIICCIRDLRSVFGSIEKHHRNSSTLDSQQSPTSKSIGHRVETMFAPDGLIGQNVQGVMDLVQRKIPNVLFLSLDALVSNTKGSINTLYNFLGIAKFEHDFDKVEYTSTDVDALYNFKFPHTGNSQHRPVKPETDRWSDYMTTGLSDHIWTSFQEFNDHFGFKRW